MSIWAKSISDSYASFGEAKTIKKAVDIFGDTCPPSPYGAGDDCALVDKSALDEKKINNAAMINNVFFLITSLK